jgi:hypothetical protein
MAGSLSQGNHTNDIWITRSRQQDRAGREDKGLTADPEIRLLCSPNLQIQAGDFLEVRIARHDGHTMLHCYRSDPDVILWNRPAFRAQVILDHPVMSCGAGIARKDCRILSELIDPRDVLRDAFRLMGAILELAENDSGNENLLSFDEMLKHRLRLCEQGDDDIRVEKEPTTHRD